MSPVLRKLLSALALGATLATIGSSAAAHDYPTADRVLYVQECMRQYPGAHYEMVNKCSCVIDKIAAQVSPDDFDTMSTATNANSISGERGNMIRDSAGMQDQIKRFRTLQAAAKKSCFINVDAK